MQLNFKEGKGTYRNWIIGEKYFDYHNPGKIESLFTLGNGYLGVRGSTEEKYLAETRGCYLAGLFDRFADEVTELPNIIDWLGMEIILAGDRFTLNRGKIINYNRRLNLKDGELIREVEWESPTGLRTKLSFRRFVSMVNHHLGVIKIKISPLNFSAQLEIISGLNGRVTNSGTQHLREGEQRVFDDGSFYLTAMTQQSGHFLITAARHRLFHQGKEINQAGEIISTRRKLALKYQLELLEGDVLCLEKTTAIYSSRDQEFQFTTADSKMEKPEEGLRKKVLAVARNDLLNGSRLGYDVLFDRHRRHWHQLWEEMDLRIKGADFEQLAVRFSLFHLRQMSPDDDSRYSIAAKGLSGEGYKGHVFWDTEIFILPFFTYTFPRLARSLLLYRYQTLPGARKNAREKGFRGAMYPWESAESGEETTPAYGSVDIKTGESIRIWSGELEQHISADIAYACWNYYRITGDTDFLYNYGAEIILETARFWSDRFEFNPGKGIYEIKDVMGPDEYAEHVNNNAYTNYLVQWNLLKAVEVSRLLKGNAKNHWAVLKKRIALGEEEVNHWGEQAEKIFLPRDMKTGLIEQFDGFREQRQIDLAPFYGKTGEILKKLSWQEITGSQVIKQADVILLLYLLGEQFSLDDKCLNWDFYEPRTLHDSSLSPGIHAILATELGMVEEGYHYFKKTCQVDLGPNPGSDGLHAAALASTWLAVVAGFLGLKIAKKGLEINPQFPENWQGIALNFHWQKQDYYLEADRQLLMIIPRSSHRKELQVKIGEREYTLDSPAGLEVNLNKN